MVLLPNRSHERTAPVWSNQNALYLETRAKPGLMHLCNVMALAVLAQGTRKEFPLFGTKSERFKETRFACAIAVRWIE